MPNLMFLFFLLLMFSSIAFLYLFFYLWKFSSSFFLEWEFFYFKSSSMQMVFFFDWMSSLFLSMVFFISSLVCLYSIKYMNFKKNQFIYLIFFFVVSMMMFILSPNILSVLLGWDGLGLVSYILIIFFQSSKSKNSGMLTLILNRIGDVLIILSSYWIFLVGGLNFLFYFNFNLKISFLLLLLASMTKSAQMPFSTWLPAAMAAPTPVSSLVHSSTLVTAGVFLMIRFSDFFYLYPEFLKILFVMGTLTMFMSGLGANFEYDLKKIIALSTLSQLGLMMMTLSLSWISLSFFHLLIHALFKALLFLCAGVIIHNFKNNQDIRKMGGVMKFMPLTIMCFNMANLSLCGFPFLSGFFSKDLIIETFIFSQSNLMIYILLMVSTMMTVSYTFRLMCFISFNKSNYFTHSSVKEDNLFSFVLVCITSFSILSGSSLNWIFMNIFFNPILFKMEKLIIPFLIVMGIILSLFFQKKSSSFFSSMWFLSILIINSKFYLHNFIHKMFFNSSLGYFEYFGGQGMMKIQHLFKLTKLFTNNFKMSILFSILLFMWM